MACRRRRAGCSGGAAAAAALVLLLASAAAAAPSGDAWELDNVSRRINLKNAWAKVIDTVTAKATGKGDATQFVVCYPEALAARIALLKVLVKKERQDVAPLDAPLPGQPAGVACFAATLRAGAPKKDAAVELDVVATVTGVYKPNPSHIRQGEKQLVEYNVDSLVLLSPYPAAKQTTAVAFPTSNVVAYPASLDDGAKAELSGSKLTLGEFGSQAAWTVRPLALHFEQTKPLKRVNSLVREIEVSHWGNIYVEETYEIQNAGAEHTGKFSRLRYAYEAGAKTNSFPSVAAKLPGPARAMYYKDVIGNISSSDTTKTGLSTNVELRLRYPLMGGWKTDFILGYSLPLEGFLYRRPKTGRLRLLTDLSTSFDDVWVERLETRVVLPEGARGIKATLAADGVEQRFEKKFTYLDTSGRPVLVLTKTNVVPEHNKPFAVDYTFSAGAMLREPLLLVLVFAGFFLAVALYTRLDLTITRDERWAEAQAGDRARGLLQELAAAWDGEAELLQQLVALEHAISSEATAEAAHAQRAALEARLKEREADARALLRQLEEVSPKRAAAARDHAERSRALQQRAAKLLGDKVDLIKRGAMPHEASAKLAPMVRAAQDAVRDWCGEGGKLAAV